ncbi:hypothetical protein [Bacillus multifaciens]|uniref:competence protein CoiA family protein n=1 Tax=Bacillus multifaciens TaxID=3068506 RepID=UPI002741F779|nr:hypothetical protein [Bacillus sp. WLY-B-L8]MDP7981336.1 hypothetical protein [Bacillus sp. WLY-B-L8]
MQYSYIKQFEGWRDIFSSGREVVFQNEQYIELDSMTIDKDTEAVYIKGRNPVYKAACPVCQDSLSFNRGSNTDEDGKHTTNRNPFFFHRSRDCFSYESLAHGHTKRYLYGLFNKAGYLVKEERRHQRIVRADVAVLQMENGREELKLAIEVQASNIRISDIARRINTYFEENCPTAWILVLDSFFPQKETEINGEKIYTDSYSGTRISNFNPEKQSYEYTYISPLKEEYFFITGTDNKAFNYLMDSYHVIVAVDHNGHVFLIRRTNESARLRVEALLENRSHSTQDDIFLVSRIEESNIVPVLLETELLRASYKEIESSSKQSSEMNEEFKGQIHISENQSNSLFDSEIEFNKAGMINESLNSIELVRETRKGLQEAYKQKLIEMELQKKEAERRKEEELAAQMAKDLVDELDKKYQIEFGLLVDRLREEKNKFLFDSVGDWYTWLKILKTEQKKWSSFVMYLYKGFSHKFSKDKNDFDCYYTNEKEMYKEWIEGRELNSFVQELYDYYKKLDKEHQDDIEQIMFCKKLLNNYEQKLVEKLRKEEVKRKEIEQKYHQEQLLQKREEERKIYEQKERNRQVIENWYLQRDILMKEPQELLQFTKQEIDNIRELFWKEIICMEKRKRISFEKEIFPAGLPQWLAAKAIRSEEIEIEADIRENKAKMKKEKENNKNNMKEIDDRFEQLTLL